MMSKEEKPGKPASLTSEEREELAKRSKREARKNALLTAISQYKGTNAHQQKNYQDLVDIIERSDIMDEKSEASLATALIKFLKERKSSSALAKLLANAIIAQWENSPSDTEMLRDAFKSPKEVYGRKAKEAKSAGEKEITENKFKNTDGELLTTDTIIAIKYLSDFKNKLMPPAESTQFKFSTESTKEKNPGNIIAPQLTEEQERRRQEQEEFILKKDASILIKIPDDQMLVLATNNITARQLMSALYQTSRGLLNENATTLYITKIAYQNNQLLLHSYVEAKNKSQLPAGIYQIDMSGSENLVSLKENSRPAPMPKTATYQTYQYFPANNAFKQVSDVVLPEDSSKTTDAQQYFLDIVEEAANKASGPEKGRIMKAIAREAVENSPSNDFKTLLAYQSKSYVYHDKNSVGAVANYQENTAGKAGAFFGGKTTSYKHLYENLFGKTAPRFDTEGKKASVTVNPDAKPHK